MQYKYKLKEMSKTASPEAAAKELERKEGEPFKIGQVSYSPDGTSKSTIYKIDDTTGAVSWRIEQLPGYDKMFEELDDLVDIAKRTASKSKDDPKFRDFYDQIRQIRNQVRTHIRKEHPEIYDRIQMRMAEGINDHLDLVHVYDKDGKMYGTGSVEKVEGDKTFVRFDGSTVKRFPSDRVKPVKEAYSGFLRNPEDPDSIPFNPTGAVAEFREDLRALFGKFKGELNNREFIGGVAEVMVNWKSLLRSQLKEALNVSRDKLNQLAMNIGFEEFAKTILMLRDENLLDDIVDAMKMYQDGNTSYYNPDVLKEKEVEEMSTSAGAGSYLTKYAFKLPKKQKKLPEGTCGYDTDAKSGKKLKTPGGLKENVGATLGPGPKAGPDGVKDNYYVTKFKYKLVPKDKNGNYVQKGSGLEVKNF